MTGYWFWYRSVDVVQDDSVSICKFVVVDVAEYYWDLVVPAPDTGGGQPSRQRVTPWALPGAS